MHAESVRVTPAGSPTCLQVQRDPRLVDVRRVTLGPDPPDRSAVYLLLRGRRHVRPAGQRPLATGGTARDSAPQQPLVHPPGQTEWEGVGCCNGDGGGGGGGRERGGGGGGGGAAGSMVGFCVFLLLLRRETLLSGQ